MAAFQDVVRPALFRGDVTCGATVEADPTASSSALVASCFRELEKLNQELKSKLRDDFMSILDGMANINFSTTSHPPSPSPSPPSRSSSLANGVPFTTEAYAWLLENIANPYPTSTVKASFTQRHNCTLSSVNSWFVNARRRIGWTALCRDYFHNCRADALDAAYRALVEDDPSRELRSHIVDAFVRVKVATEELYSSTLTKSALVCHLDAVVSDMSDVSSNESEQIRPDEVATLNIDSQTTTLAAQSCYPSPDRSPSHTPTPPLDTSFGGSGDAVPVNLASRKRRLSSLEVSQTTGSESAARPPRRPRCSPSPAVAYLPSPATAVEEFLGDDQTTQFDTVAQDSEDSQTRKRRLSDAGTERQPKRLRDSATVPHHTISDPSTPSAPENEYSIDEWFKANVEALFTLPPPVNVAEPDTSTQWEVELFNNYNMPGNPPMTTAPGNDVPPSTDLPTLDDLFQFFENDTFAPLDNHHLPVVTSIPDPVPQCLPDLPDFPQPIDWDALLNEDHYEHSNDPTFSQLYVNTTLPEIDLSMLQLPQAWASVAL